MDTNVVVAEHLLDEARAWMLLLIGAIWGASGTGLGYILAAVCSFFATQYFCRKDK